MPSNELKNPRKTTWSSQNWYLLNFVLKFARKFGVVLHVPSHYESTSKSHR